MAFRGIPEGIDQGVPIEGRLDDSALRAGTAAVDKPDFSEPCFVSVVKIFVDYGADIPWRERMEVKHALDWHVMGLLGVAGLVTGRTVLLSNHVVKVDCLPDAS